MAKRPNGADDDSVNGGDLLISCMVVVRISLSPVLVCAARQPCCNYDAR